MTPLLLLYTRNSCKRSKILFYVFQTVLFLVSFAITSLLQNSTNLHDYFLSFEISGVKTLPSSRIGAYLIGYNLGITFYQFRKLENKDSHKLIRFLQKKKNRALFRIAPIGFLIACIFYFNWISKQSLNYIDYVALTSLNTLIPLAVIIIVIPSLFGYHSPVTVFFESNTCNVISKLSMSIYAIHFSYDIYIVYSRLSDLYVTNKTIILMSICSFIPVAFLSIFLTTLI